MIIATGLRVEKNKRTGVLKPNTANIPHTSIITIFKNVALSLQKLKKKLKIIIMLLTTVCLI